MPPETLTHNDLWDRIVVVERDLTVLSERIDMTKEVVIANQLEFRERCQILEEKSDLVYREVGEVGTTVKTAGYILSFLITAGITLLGFYLTMNV